MKRFIGKYAIIYVLTFGLLLGSERTRDQSGELAAEAIAVDSQLVLKAMDSVIIACKRIVIEGYPQAYNPSIVRLDQGLLLLFRSLPDPIHKAFVSDLGAVWLNENLEPISSPQLIVTRRPGDPTPQQSEDVRVLLWGGEPYLIYNDNVEVVNPSEWDRRDIFIAKLNYQNGQFSVDEPKKLMHADNYEKVKWQKNWMPFDWKGKLLISYTINPHEILVPDLDTGFCHPIYSTKGEITWHWGKLRGGTLAQEVDGRYLAFFHSPISVVSETTQGRQMMHYFMGAYTFSAEPPFAVTSISPYPIVAEGFYTPSPLGIRCIYPGGFVTAGPNFYVVYGKDDQEVWAAVIDKKKLYASLLPITKVENDIQSSNEGY